ncbi:metacaspase [Cryptococcus neoformans A2-102-5]|nr:metacaspase [Cryptococcus neoformans var. grubii D17-1]OXG99158.1 metacaspase [Cryptococcus neoformans var. grubii A2-102-5]
MSDYGDEHYQSGEREVEYRDEDDERGYERYESPPRSPARSSSNSSKSSSSSSSGAGGESRHGDHSEEEERYSDENYRSQQESNNFGNAAAMGIVTGMMGNLMGSRNGASNREAGGNYYPASSGQYRNGYNGYQNGYQQLVYRQNGYGQESYGQQQQGYGENEYCDGGYGGNYPHPGPPPQQYEPTNAGYAPPPAPYSGQQQHYGGYRANESDDGRPHPQHFGPEFRDSQTGEVAQAFFEYSRCNGRRKALLIGINYIGSSAQLAGCINDVHNVQKFITERYGYQLDDIVMLTDDINDARTMPTRDNIIKAMKWLVGGAQRDDALFFHYSGHGTQTEDTDGDEQDGQDEGEFSSRFITSSLFALSLRVVALQRSSILVTLQPSWIYLTFTPPTALSKGLIFQQKLLRVFLVPVWIFFEEIPEGSCRACLEPRKARGLQIKRKKRRRRPRRALRTLSCGRGVRTTRLARILRKMVRRLEPCPTHLSPLSTNDLIRATKSCSSRFEMR